MSGVGQTVRMGVRVRGDDGADLNAGTITCTLTRPDGTTEVLVVANPPAVTGRYRVEYVPTMAGLYAYRFATTAPATVFESTFYVTAPGAVGAISLAEAKDLLKISAEDTKQDRQVESVVRAATELAEERGRKVLMRRTITETYDLGFGYRAALALVHRPVVRPVLVERLATAGVVVESAEPPAVWTTEHGILRTARPALLWGLVRVTYIAGPAVLSQTDREAVEILVQHLWPSHAGSGSRPRVGGKQSEEARENEDGTAIPTRVTELLGPRGPLVG